MGKFAKLLTLFTLTTSAATAAEVAPSPLHSVTVGRAQLDVPSDFEWRSEGKTVLLGQLRDSDDVMMSLSVVTVERNGKLVADAGPLIAAQSGTAARAELQSNGAWYKTSSPPPNAKQGAVTHEWHFGAGPHIVVMTCVIDISAVDSDRARAILAALPKTIRSLRTAP